MNKYMTEEQANLIIMVHEHYGKEFAQWMLVHEEYLMKWFENTDFINMDVVQAAGEFTYYCAIKFMEKKFSNVGELN